MFGLLGRYLALILLALGNLFIFYTIFNSLTLYPVSFILSIFYKSALLLKGTNTIFIEGDYINLISACIAGAAYYFLFALNLSTPMPVKTRINSLLFLVFSFLFINIMRIVIFSVLFILGYQYFDLTHKLIWNFGSTILLIIIWFVNAKIFDINNVPIYTDVKNIWEDVKR